VEAVIVVGGKGSANTRRLAEIAESKGAPTFFVENEEELNLDELKQYKTVGVIGGASTPDWALQHVVDTVQSVPAQSSR
jgi:4-hydroxy-3-methylbut-2-enyl diphosphate reductase